MLFNNKKKLQLACCIGISLFIGVAFGILALGMEVVILLFRGYQLPAEHEVVFLAKATLIYCIGGGLLGLLIGIFITLYHIVAKWQLSIKKLLMANIAAMLSFSFFIIVSLKVNSFIQASKSDPISIFADISALIVTIILYIILYKLEYLIAKTLTRN